MDTDLALEAQPAVRFLDWPESVALGAVVAVTTRHGGVSEGAHSSLNLALHVGDDPERVLINRERAANAFGVELDDVVFNVPPQEAVTRVREDVDGFSGDDIAIVATGHTAPLLLPELHTVKHYDQHLTLDGLRLVFERNRDTQRGRLKTAR